MDWQWGTEGSYSFYYLILNPDKCILTGWKEYLLHHTPAWTMDIFIHELIFLWLFCSCTSFLFLGEVLDQLQANQFEFYVWSCFFLKHLVVISSPISYVCVELHLKRLPSFFTLMFKTISVWGLSDWLTGAHSPKVQAAGWSINCIWQWQPRRNMSAHVKSNWSALSREVLLGGNFSVYYKIHVHCVIIFF